jgi:hypothetical protein
MSESETLRLIAEVVDKYSGPLKSMQNSLKNMAGASRDVHEKGVTQAGRHAKAYRELGEQIRKVKDGALDVVKPAFSALGLEALTVAGAIAAVGKAVKDFGESGQRLEFARRASGLAAGTVRGLSEAGEALGVSTEQTNAALTEFGAHMDALQRRAPAALQAYNQLPGLWQKLGKSLQDMPREAQLDQIFRFLPTVRDTDQRKQVLRFYGLPEDWANLTEQELTKFRQKGEEFNKRFPFNAENAARAKEAFDDLGSTFRGLKESLGGEFAPGVAAAVKDINDTLADKELMTQFGGAISSIAVTFGTWHEHVSGVKSEMRDIIAVVNAAKWLFDTDKKISETVQKALTGGKGYNGNPFSTILQGKLPETNNPDALKDAVRDGVRLGVIDAYGSWSPAQKLAAGMSPVAYHPDATPGRGGASFGSARYPGISEDTAKAIEQTSRSIGGTNGRAQGDASDAAANGTLAQRRARFAQEMQDPKVRDEVKGMLHTEGTALPTLEALMNRQEMTGGSLHRGLHSGFYGPINRGQLPGAIAAVHNNKKLNDKYEAAIDKALAGSNIIKGYTDQGMPSDPNGSLRSAATARDHIRIGGNEFTDWGGAGRKRAHDFRITQQDAIAKAAMAEQEHGHGARLADHIRHGRAQSTNSLLTNGKRSEAGETRHSASLDINLAGFPRGTTTKQATTGTMFKEVKLNRGYPMTTASSS